MMYDIIFDSITRGGGRKLASALLQHLGRGVSSPSFFGFLQGIRVKLSESPKKGFPSCSNLGECTHVIETVITSKVFQSQIGMETGCRREGAWGASASVFEKGV